MTTLTTNDYAAIAAAVAATMQTPSMQAALQPRRKALPGDPSALYIHGPGGLFSTCGLDRNVFSAMLLPQGGLGDRLPVYDSNIMDTMFALLTGVGSATGDNPDAPCDDPKSAGFLYGCHQTFPFGRYSMQTTVFDVDRAAQRVRGERMDLRLIGGLQPVGGALGMSNMANNPLASDLAANLFSMGVGWRREVYPQIFTGNPANNSVGGGYREFRGLDLQINTGFVDAIDNVTLCPAVDSEVVAFGANIATDPAVTINTFVDAYNVVKRRATLTGLDPVQFAWVMSYQLFHELTEFWPCAYATYRCSGVFAAGDERSTDSFRINELRDDMRNGQYLLINGAPVPVIVDDFIAETNNLGTLTSSAYLVPLTVAGGVASLYWEAINYDAPDGAMAMARFGAARDAFYTTDGGRFLWSRKPNNNFCVQVVVKTEPRLVLRTPHLAARITGISYTPSTILPNATPGHPGYANGGVQSV